MREPTVRLLCGNSFDLLQTLDANSIDTVITDPPYGLAFMGKEWDHGIPGVEFWVQVLRVAKPGAMLLACGGTRTFHRLTCAIEDAGWEVRDCLMWLYGSGFPKSHDISKAIDAQAGITEWKETRPNPAWRKGNGPDATTSTGWQKPQRPPKPVVETDAAQEWQGWGTALKPAWESIIVASKPLPEVEERGIIVGNLTRLEAQLWLLSYASTAGNSSASSPAGLAEAFATARWSAERLTSIRESLFAQMDTSRCESVIRSSWNTVLSWRHILGEVLNDGSTSTTSTASSPTIDWKTLRYLLSQTTVESIIRAETQALGSASSALPVGVYLSAVAESINATRTLSALASATSEAQAKHLEGIGPLAPNWEPIILAMKPLDGTFAQNALRHGVAGLAIDKARIEGVKGIPASPRKNAHGGASGGIYGEFAPPSTDTAGWDKNAGRWPANLLLDEEAAQMLDAMSGASGSGVFKPRSQNRTAVQFDPKRGWNQHSMNPNNANAPDDYGDQGGASRFFYVAKASRAERERGLEGMPERVQLRGDLTEEQTAYVMGELQRLGLA